jgi:hypothetical protein
MITFESYKRSVGLMLIDWERKVGDCGKMEVATLKGGRRSKGST